MKVVIDNNTYEVIVVKKYIKNIYIRVKEDLKIYVTCNILTTNNYIEELLNKNISSIKKMIERVKRKIERDSKFIYLGVPYRVILCNVFKKPTIVEDIIYVHSLTQLDKFLSNEAKRVLPLRVQEWYEKMKDYVSYPKVVIRKMVRKWGYCNKSQKLITLNSELIKHNIEEIDYVVVHELCHFIYFDHSKNFWKCVEKFIPNYKKLRKALNDEE